MDLRNMRHLLAIRRHGSLARAAEALGMSQPSLSSAIVRLEDQLGAPLVNRTAAGSELTVLGEMVADRADRVMGEMDHILRDVALMAGGEIGALRLGIGSALRDGFMPAFVTRVAQRHPGVRSHVQVLDRSDLVPMLRAREMDMVVCAVGEEFKDEDLVCTPVLRAAVWAVASPGHPLARETAISVRTLSEYPAAGVALPGFSNIEVMRVDGEQGHLGHYTANDYAAMIPLVVDGMATLIAPDFVVAGLVASGALARLDLDWSYRVTYAAITLRAATPSPILSRLIQYALEIGEEVQLAGSGTGAGEIYHT